MSVSSYDPWTGPRDGALEFLLIAKSIMPRDVALIVAKKVHMSEIIVPYRFGVPVFCFFCAKDVTWTYNESWAHTCYNDTQTYQACKMCKRPAKYINYACKHHVTATKKTDNDENIPCYVRGCGKTAEFTFISCIKTHQP